MFKNIQIFPVQYTPTSHDHQYINVLNRESSVQPSAIDFVKNRDCHYYSMDPRTFDTTRNMRIPLDAPPFQSQGTQPLQDIYSGPSSEVKTGYYNSYEDIKGGSIIYYTDLDNDPPGKSASLISIPIYSVPTILVDPMGAVRPYYKRLPLMDKKTDIYEYSFLADTAEFREDLQWRRREKPRKASSSLFWYYNDRERYYPTDPNLPIKGHLPLTQIQPDSPGPRLAPLPSLHHAPR